METVAEKNLKTKWEALIKEQPHLRIRNAAEVLGVSELELLVTKIGDGVTTLKPEFQNILGEIEPLGKVMALTRNNEVVHERKGVYLNPELNNPHVGLFVGEDIDLRIFFSCWGYAFAVEEEGRKSLQFFAKNGEAVHKIYLTNKSNEAAFQELVEKYKAEEQNLVPVITPTPEKEAEKSDSEIDINGFQDAWVNLKDTHHFFGMLKKYGVTRTQALRIAPEGNYAVKVDNLACRNLLEQAAKEGVEIMVFVGNPGMIQIHTGPVKKVVEARGWYNVLDPDFNLHIKEAEITDSWIVRKPTEDGVVTALECFNKDGEQIVQLFGKRKPGIPELASWRDIVANVEQALRLN
jgi:putative hemin transport protein